MSSALSSAAQDRKSRLAHLKTLKNKQSVDPSTPTDKQETRPREEGTSQLKRKLDGDEDEDAEAEIDKTASLLSGRNYDATTKGPKLGFENAPRANNETIEQRAATLASAAEADARKKQAEDKPLDLSTLQPKKPNWDLKRHLNQKLEVLAPRTQNAIGKLVRERIASAKQQQLEQQASLQAKSESGHASNGREKSADADEEGQAIGLDGTALVEATKEREREEQEDARREREYNDES